VLERPVELKNRAVWHLQNLGHQQPLFGGAITSANTNIFGFGVAGRCGLQLQNCMLHRRHYQSIGDRIVHD
jgi:hypothetical protein